MKLSLLELTQVLLSSMDSDEVNSISDTSEARQVAQVIRTAYFNILARANLPEHQQLFSLTASGDMDQPVLMIKPDNVTRMEWIKYNKATDTDPEDNFAYVTILPLQQFLDLSQQLNTTETEVGTFTFNNHTFYFRNDRAPCYCTVVDDLYVVFDSYDNEVDDTLQTSKTQCFGQTVPTFLLEDDYVPTLDDQQFPLLINEAKALAFFELKQLPHQKAEQESRRQWITLQRTKRLDKRSDFDQLPDFGRSGSTSSSTFPRWMRGQ